MAGRVDQRGKAMKLFGKSLGDYLQFEKGLLIATIVIGLIRLALTLARLPDSVVTWFSMTALTLFSIVYLPVTVHRRGFGSYRHVLVLLALQIGLSSVIIAIGIGVAATTGVYNIFQADRPNANPIAHAVQHLIGGPTIFALIFWLPASVVLFITKMLTPARTQ
jgi:hypothetical protein